MKKYLSIFICIGIILSTLLLPVMAYSSVADAPNSTVSNVVFSDEVGTVITKMPNNGKVKISADISSNSEQKPVMIVSTYNNENIVASVKVAQASNIGNTYSALTEPVSQNDKIVVYFWNGTNSIEPLARTANFPSDNTKIDMMLINGLAVDATGNEITYQTQPQVIPNPVFAMADSGTKVECSSQATKIPGDSIYTFTSSNGTKRNFVIHFDLEEQYKIYASEISVNGTALSSFNKQRSVYEAQVPYESTSATVAVTPEDATVLVSYSPSQTINPAETDKVVATLTSADGRITKDYTINVRGITITSSAIRTAYLGSYANNDENVIKLAQTVVGDQLKETYTTDNVEKVGPLGSPVYTRLLSGSGMMRLANIGPEIANYSHIITSNKDSNKQAQKDSKWGAAYKSSGGYMYKSNQNHFSFVASNSGTAYVYTAGDAGSMYSSWGTSVLGDSNQLHMNEIFTDKPTVDTAYTNIYVKTFKAGDTVSLPTIGQDSYNVIKTLIKWNPIVSSNNNLSKLAYKVDGGAETTLEKLDEQTVTLPNTAGNVEVVFEAESSKIQSVSATPSGIVSIGDVPVTVSVKVVAEDGSEKVYKVTFAKESAPEIPLATGISVNGVALTSFNSARTLYDAQVPYESTEATVTVTAEANVTVMYSPSQTINPTTTDTVVATLTSADGRGTKDYTIKVRGITITPSDIRTKYLGGYAKDDDNIIKLSQTVVGDQLEETYTADNVLKVGPLGSPVYTRLLSGSGMMRLANVGPEIANYSHVITSNNDSNKQAQKVSKWGAAYKSAGGYMYKSNQNHFSFVASNSGTAYVYTVGAAGNMYSSWGTSVLGDSNQLYMNEIFTNRPIVETAYTNIYVRQFNAGDTVTLPTIGQDSYNVIKALIKWDDMNAQPPLVSDLSDTKAGSTPEFNSGVPYTKEEGNPLVFH